MTSASDTIVIPTWANGPDGSGNGGWSAGLLAPHVPVEAGSGVAVSLRVPPPLGRELHVGGDESGAGRLLVDRSADEPVLVAHAEPAPVSLDAPGAVRAIDVEAARAASAGFAYRDEHPFPRCVSCGIARAEGEPSLELHCGPLEGVTVRTDDAEPTPVFADVWVPTPDMADGDDPEVASIAACWSALDCPSAAPMANPDASPIVLARIAARIETRARIGEPHVLAAWFLSRDGRKLRSRSVMLDVRGEVLGAAEALWIEVRRQ